MYIVIFMIYHVIISYYFRQFQDKKRRGNIDIWWLYDDGGMPPMLAHILQSRYFFAFFTAIDAV